MSPPRLGIRICRLNYIRPQQRRCFASNREILDLAYDRYEPPEKSAGSRNAPIVFIHGFFGSKKNNRSMSKVLARDLNRDVYAIDLRNHGESPHNPTHDYRVLAADIENFLAKHKLHKPTLIGHSMGAKAAMSVALQHPSTVGALIPVDNAPVDANFHSDFGLYLQGMREVERAQPKRQAEADEILKPYAKVFWPDWAPSELAVRQFLLTNLIRSPENKEILTWRVPIDILSDSLDNMMDFPHTNPDEMRYSGPTLFVRGTRSHYVPDETLPIIGRFFPRFEVRDVEAGHWVISENPEEFRRVVVEWLQDKE